MMTSAAEQYRKELKKHLSLDVCSGKLRTALLSRFDAMLGAMKEDCPEPAMAQLETAFGTPTQMAQDLLADTPDAERVRRQRTFRTVRAVLLTVAVVGLAVGLAYAWYFKSFSIHAQDTVIIWK